jgi:hypothetical protein
MVEAIVAAVHARPSVFNEYQLHHIGGAVARVSAGNTAYPDRDAAFTYNVIGVWDSPTDDAANRRWARVTTPPPGEGPRHRRVERAAGASFIPGGVEHEVVDDQLPAPVEQLQQAGRAAGGVEDVAGVELDHRQLPTARGECVAGSGELLLRARSHLSRVTIVGCSQLSVRVWFVVVSLSGKCDVRPAGGPHRYRRAGGGIPHLARPDKIASSYMHITKRPF